MSDASPSGSERDFQGAANQAANLTHPNPPPDGILHPWGLDELHQYRLSYCGHVRDAQSSSCRIAAAQLVVISMHAIAGSRGRIRERRILRLQTRCCLGFVSTIYPGSLGDMTVTLQRVVEQCLPSSSKYRYHTKESDM